MSEDQEEVPTADELEDFRRRHWMHWNLADNLLISHLVARMRLSTPPLTAPAAPEAVGERETRVFELKGGQKIQYKLVDYFAHVALVQCPPGNAIAEFKGPHRKAEAERLIAILNATPLKQEGAEPDPNAPKEIWLQLYGDSSADEGPVDYTHDVSWCWHQVFESDVRYVQATAQEPAPQDGAEPVAWQWRRKGEPWSLEYTFNTSVFATTPETEVRPLYAQEPAPQGDAEDAARYRWLRDHWLEVHACPAKGRLTGVRILCEDDDGIGEGGERLDAAIDSARSGAKP